MPREERRALVSPAHGNGRDARAEGDVMRLHDRVIVVTGGGLGIGRAYSLGVAAEGARVVVADVADPQPTVKEIEARGGQALGVSCDVSREEDTLRLATEALARFGRIDVLVNNAAIYGTLTRRPFMEIPVDEWDRVMAVNLRGLFLCARAVFPAMKAQGKGKIINITSSTFFRGVPNYIHYTTSKGGVVGFTRSLARELGDFGIRVNAVAPGFTLSGANEANLSPEGKEANIRMRMLKRAEVPDDLVGTIVFLASDDSDFITGQTIAVDGGSIVH
jgi:NAD(P)-dependent dehydrogenase (short-subunit alcohol dehydrogenase family)